MSCIRIRHCHALVPTHTLPMGDGDSMIWIVLDADEEDGEPLAKFFSMTDLSSKAYGGSAGNPSDRAARRAALPKNSAVLVKATVPSGEEGAGAVARSCFLGVLFRGGDDEDVITFPFRVPPEAVDVSGVVVLPVDLYFCSDLLATYIFFGMANMSSCTCLKCRVDAKGFKLAAGRGLQACELRSNDTQAIDLASKERKDEKKIAAGKKSNMAHVIAVTAEPILRIDISSQVTHPASTLASARSTTK